MARRKTLCELYERDQPHSGNDLKQSYYWAVVTCETLPRQQRRDDRIVTLGYAVDLGPHFFFPALEPAMAFGRAARMSVNCHAYALRRAAQIVMFCPTHCTDELVLLVTVHNLDRKEGEVEVLKRFVQGVKEHPWSSHWHEPTESTTDYNKGRPTRTRQPSVPL